jgi:hypothetical protein
MSISQRKLAAIMAGYTTGHQFLLFLQCQSYLAMCNAFNADIDIKTGLECSMTNLQNALLYNKVDVAAIELAQRDIAIANEFILSQITPKPVVATVDPTE